MTTTYTQNCDSISAPKLDQDYATTPPRTPTATTTAAHKLVAEIQSIYNDLTSVTSLAPGPQINSLLTRLVELCVLPYSADLSEEILRLCASTTLCERLRPLCAAAEGELESHWAKHIIAETKNRTSSPQPSPTNPLNSFPYHQNYIDLSRLECASLEAFLPSAPHNLAFIGSGPLPLTSLCVLDHYPTASVHNIDRDAPALKISKELCAQLGYGKRMTFSCEDVNENSLVGRTQEKETDWQSFDIVFLAALVGMDSYGKIAILKNLARKLRPGTVVVARSAKGLRRVLYPVLELGEDLERAGYEVLVEVHPWTKVVNSVIVLRVKER
ncbi:Nicotianamine synthase [Plenodomus tracheiphilus IPT5]|uniref:Nicotianamine synthase n=1 Tax=Plenodomus tracheiphilus IPT5 TaxID=1408161 RepID=A0A6A7BAP9_9PLEO|nr:Nicotianamine synthase [Plenodomus tracheiphilus IPT5]